MKFSQLYCDIGDVRSDSDRMRVRLLSKFELLPIEQYDVAKIIKLECGKEVECDWNGYYDFPEFFKEGEIRDVLDTLTFIFAILKSKGRSQLAEEWVGFANKVFREENVKYQMDSEGVVHLFIDESFEIMRKVALSQLDQPNLTASRQHYEMTFQYLDQLPMNTRGAVRSIFDAVESVAKEISGGAQLNQSLIMDKLKPLILGDCGNENLALQKLLRSFVEWVNACHFYRHAQEQNKATPPSINTTILIITQGSGFLRLLCSINLGRSGN